MTGRVDATAGDRDISLSGHWKWCPSPPPRPGGLLHIGEERQVGQIHAHERQGNGILQPLADRGDFRRAGLQIRHQFQLFRQFRHVREAGNQIRPRCSIRRALLMERQCLVTDPRQHRTLVRRQFDQQGCNPVINAPTAATMGVF